MKCIILFSAIFMSLAGTWLHAGAFVLQEQWWRYEYDLYLDFSDYLDGHSFSDGWQQTGASEFKFSDAWQHEGVFESISGSGGFSKAEYWSDSSIEISSLFSELDGDASQLELQCDFGWEQTQVTLAGDHLFQYRSLFDGGYSFVLSEPMEVVISMRAELEGLMIASDPYAEVRMDVNLGSETINKQVQLRREVISNYQSINLSTYRYFELDAGYYNLSVTGDLDIYSVEGGGFTASEGTAHIEFIFLARPLSAPGLPIELLMTASHSADHFVFDLRNLRFNEYYQLQGSEDLSFSNPEVHWWGKRTALIPEVEVDTSELGSQYFFRLVED